MSVRAVRAVVIVVCVLGIAGMIITSITDHNGAAITFGLITAVAILCSMVATAVTRGSPGAPPAAGRAGDDDALGASIEARIAALVDGGADEAAVRALVGEAVRFGRSVTAPGTTA